MPLTAPQQQAERRCAAWLNGGFGVGHGRDEVHGSSAHVEDKAPEA
jgi:hypothetical protein